MITDNSLFERRIKREISARKAAEAILEKKSLELYEANQKLKELNSFLESEVKKRSVELAETEAQYQDFVNSAHDLIFSTAVGGTITYANELARTLYGYRPEGVVGTNFAEYIHPDYRESVIKSIAEAHQQRNESFYVECPSFEWNGKWIWLGLKLQFRYDKDNKLVEVLTIGRDITEQKDRERDLINTQIQLKELITNMHQGILFEAIDGSILQINQFYCDFFGIPQKPEELIGKHISVTYPYDVALIEDGLKLPEKLALEGREVIGKELILLDGRCIRFDFIPVLRNNVLIGYLRQFIDNTEQKELEIQIRNSEEKYRGIIESLELGLLEVDNDGIIIRSYEWFCKMTGYTEAELIGQNSRDFLLPPEFRGRLDENEVLRASGKQSVYEVQLIKKNGERIWVIISGAPFYNTRGEIVGSIGIHFDISNRKRLEAELIKAREIAERAQEVERQFLANMSHEIRTPLNAVIGMSHLLYDTNPSQEQKEYVEMIRYSAKLLANLVNDILDFSKIQSGHMDLNETEFDLKALIQTLHKIFKLKAVNKPMEIKAEYPELDTLVFGDETLINQVLFNLMGNAEKFTEKGEIRITTTITPIKNDLISVRFDVADTGIGIASDKLKSIFNEFDQENRETKLKYGGTGLGLTITKKIVDFLDGELTVTSEKGKGSVFSVTLPLKLTDKPIGLEVATYESNSAGKSVLVVEDNIMNQNYIKRLLEKESIEYDIANNGQEGVNLAKKKKYDLIFMDISMPVMDGYEATINIRNSPSLNSETPIIALTASAVSMKKNKAFEVGMTDYMTKPFTPNEIKRTLSKFFVSTSDEAADIEPDSEADTSLLDSETLKMFYADDNAYAAEMFEIFLTNFDEQYKLLSEAISIKNWDEAQKFAHKMKPTFSLVGAPGLQEEFQELEDGLRHKNESAINTNWEEASALIETYLPAIRAEYERIRSV